jgi:hypothetical protein
MDRHGLLKLASDPKFIPGIYNYCDRWCERCRFTSRCLIEIDRSIKDQGKEYLMERNDKTPVLEIFSDFI